TSGRRISDQMSAILDAKRKLERNMNPQLMMEQLVLKLQEGSSFV
ncbi:MAG: DNA polymerase III subunit delta', partial [Bacillus sp. (in: firmicutes)]